MIRLFEAAILPMVHRHFILHYDIERRPHIHLGHFTYRWPECRLFDSYISVSILRDITRALNLSEAYFETTIEGDDSVAVFTTEASFKRKQFFHRSVVTNKRKKHLVMSSNRFRRRMPRY